MFPYAVRATDVPYSIDGPHQWPAVHTRTFILAHPAVVDRSEFTARNKPCSLRPQPPTLVGVPPRGYTDTDESPHLDL